MSFRLKRVYEPPATEDGQRVLVDRLWPRGLRREKAALAAWMKDIAPTSSLRVWFDHRPERFNEFSRRYRKELTRNVALQELKRLGKRDRVTLVYGARDPQINHAAVLVSLLVPRSRRRPAKSSAK
jgi:uncharacterized protein YeaO (DUF488 family)